MCAGRCGRRVLAWCRDQGCGRADPQYRLGSGDADVAWASKVQHAVERVDGDRHLGPLQPYFTGFAVGTLTASARRSSVCARNSSPITCFHLFMVASTRARLLYPDAFCHAMHPCSAMCWRWPSRCVGAVPAVSLGTALVRGGYDHNRLGMAPGDAGVNAILVIGRCRR